MAVDWLADVRKYASDADEKVVGAIVRYCGIALQSRDTSLVAFSDKKETDLVRENYLKKKLGLTQDDATLNAAIAAVGTRMKPVRFKNRVTVYYLLAEHFAQLGIFGGVAKVAAKAAAKAPAKAPAKAKVAPKTAVTAVKPVAPKSVAKASTAKIAAVGAVAAGAAAVASSSAKIAAPVAAATPVATAAPVVAAAAITAPLAAMASRNDTAKKGDHAFANPPSDPTLSTGCGTGLAVLGMIIFAALLAWLAYRPSTPVPVVASAPAVVAAAPAPVVSVPGPAPVAVPQGSGVVAAERDAKPMLTVYFDTGKSAVSPDFATASAAVVAYLKANPAATVAVSGFNDPTGNAAANERLSKKRAENVKAAIEALGIPTDKVVMEKPAEASGTGATNAESRRVEAVVKG